MLKSVHLKNFKLHEDTLVEAAPITVFIGPNNSGKSSIFQILLCLRDAAARGGSQLLVPGPGQVLDAGDFANVVRLGQKEIQASLSGLVDPADSSKRKTSDRGELRAACQRQRSFL
jgi:predicted ATPase